MKKRELSMYLLLIVAVIGTVGIIALGYWALVARSQHQRGQGQSHNHDLPHIAAEFARYFGTWRERELTGDPVVHGERIIDFLASIPGPDAQCLREIAAHYVGEERYPEILKPGSALFDSLAQAISGTCRVLGKSWKL